MIVISLCVTIVLIYGISMWGLIAGINGGVIALMGVGFTIMSLVAADLHAKLTKEINGSEHLYICNPQFKSPEDR